MLRIFAKILAVAAIAVYPAAARADHGDSASDAPGGFADAIQHTHAVLLRVPVDAAGRENTGAAELRFYQANAPVTAASNPELAWSHATDLGRTPEVMGRNSPQGDSPTWGWWYWYNVGWVNPYYYSYYYPTFYWNNYYYNYSYAWYWNWYGYRYYWYNWYY
jgi:hypothetical protein